MALWCWITMINDVLLRLGFGLVLVALGLYSTLRRQVSVRRQRRTASGENLGSQDFTLEGGPAVLLGLASLVSGVMFAAPVAIGWLQAEPGQVESIPGGAIPLFVGGLVVAVIWQLARRARTFFASG